MGDIRRRLIKIAAGAYGQITDPISNTGIMPNSEYPGPGEYEPLVRSDTGRRGKYPTSKYSTSDEASPPRFIPRNNLTASIFAEPKKETEEVDRYRDLVRK